MLNRLILVLHWGVFVASVGCLLVGALLVIGSVVIPEPTWKDVPNPNYGNCPKKTDLFSLDNITCEMKTFRKYSSTLRPPDMDEGFGLMVFGLVRSIVFTIFLFIIKGRWIWLPWQHDKD